MGWTQSLSGSSVSRPQVDNRKRMQRKDDPQEDEESSPRQDHPGFRVSRLLNKKGLILQIRGSYEY